MSAHDSNCPDCQQTDGRLDRRRFLQTTGAVVAVSAVPTWALADDAAKASEPESVVKTLYESFTPEQKSKICFAWDHMDSERGLLRTRVSNNWQITEENIHSDFYNKDQQEMIRAIYEGIIHPDWHKRIDKQLQDDAGGYGEDQSIALFGEPNGGKFEFVMTGRHMTIRCDGNSADHVAFGGPIFYGHAASGFDEPADHPGNVFWPHAVEANKLFAMLDGKQRELALVAKLPDEQAVAFRGTGGGLPGIPVAELSSDQKEHTQKVLQSLLGHYRQSDQDEATSCLKTQGGLDACSLAFYQEGDTGDDGVWDCWRIEGPAFVWYFRGSPHVHVWANVSSDPSVKTNA